MTFKEQRLAFAKMLQAHYPIEEINSFFSLLMEHYFNLNRFETHQKEQEVFPAEKAQAFKDAMFRLKNNEPIQYIIGETQFFGLPFKVTKDTLIPRPETEDLVALVISVLKRETSEVTILDIGTGSGCIAISLAKNIESARVSALDFSANAITIAKENAQMNAVEIDFIEQDILSVKELDKKYDVIVSNPPYVRDLEKEFMQPNVLEFEPESALFVRDDNPLIFYRSIAALAKTSLNSNGFLFFEINEYLGNEMTDMLAQHNFTEISVIKDIYGKDRMIQCKPN